MDEYFPDPELVRVIAEPGRYYVASAFVLATNIHSKREIPSGEEVAHIMYYINDGVYGSFNSLLYDHAQVTPTPLNVSSSQVIYYITCSHFLGEKIVFFCLVSLVENKIDVVKTCSCCYFQQVIIGEHASQL